MRAGIERMRTCVKRKVTHGCMKSAGQDLETHEIVRVNKNSAMFTWINHPISLSARLLQALTHLVRG